jgi:IMP dehydrogenase/GMP reductase
MRIINEVKLDFKDVLICPKRSTLSSRKEVSLERTYTFYNSKKVWTGIPVIAANMDKTGTISMAKAFEPYKALVALHKHYSLKELTEFFSVARNAFYSTGIGKEDEAKLTTFMKTPAAANIVGICVDVANGYTQAFIDYIKRLRDTYPTVTIMAGNVVTPEMTEELLLSGADIVKAGIGGGCFAAGTQVLMADGSYKGIETIVPGDRVINMHGKPVTVKKSFCTGVKEVVKVKHGYWPDETVVTSDHQFWVSELKEGRIETKWKAVGECTRNNRALFPVKTDFDGGKKGSLEPVTSWDQIGSYKQIPIDVEATGVSLQVYDIEVDCDTHSFIANNMIVHNSVCLTRRQAGVGYPQLSAVIECADAAHGLGGLLCSDGGCTIPGDVSKAFAAGGDFVMLGGMLAGFDENEGSIVEVEGKQFVEFYGMSSDTAMKKYAGGVANYRSSEGKTVLIPYKGPVSARMDDITGGVRSTCTYVGAKSLKELSKRTTFVRVTQQINNTFGETKY